jgi:uncharacterized membrane protein
VTPDKVLEGLKARGVNDRVLKTSRNVDKEEELQKTLE